MLLFPLYLGRMEKYVAYTFTYSRRLGRTGLLRGVCCDCCIRQQWPVDMDDHPTNKRTRSDMKQPSPHTSNTPTTEGMHTNVQEAVGDSIGRGAVYLAAAWDEYIRHEFEAHDVEDTRVDWQGTRYVLG